MASVRNYQKVSESAFDMAMDIDSHKSYSHDTNMDIGQSPLLEPGPSHPSCDASSHLTTEGIQYMPSKDMGPMQTSSARAIDCVVG